jgi:4-hydroxybutyryl-CoA dehydratase/vinylacetyl-CoA-Delta-isomerase
VEKASHIKDKLVEMTHLNETIYSSCVAGAARSVTMHSGAQINDEMLSNVAKQNVTRFPYDIARLAQDIAGGLIVTMPSEKELMNKETGPLMRKFLQTKGNVSVTDRMRMLRLIENMTIGRNAVGYLTESLHGAGSPQAQRIEIGRGMELEIKKGLALYLCGAAKDRIVPVKMLIGHEEPRLPIDHVGVGQSREVELTHAWVGEIADA